MFAVAIETPGDLLRRARESRRPKLTQRDVAALLGINEERYRSYEYNRVRFPVEFAKVLAAEWNIPFQSFYGDEPPFYLQAKESPLSYDLRPEPSGRVKIYGSASAGDGNTGSYDSDEIEVPIQFARADYGALVVEGDSMMPALFPGDVCIFKDSAQPKLDAIVAATTASNEWVIKRMVFDSGMWRLTSENDRCDPVDGPFRIHGLLVGIIRDDGPERLIRMNPFGLRL